MLSLYLHIPFCDQKCAYCSFSSFPITKVFPPLQKEGDHEVVEDLISNYINELIKEINHYGEIFPNEEIKTLYIGGGTPSKVGIDNLIKIIDTVKQNFNLENIEEFSIELNPNPQDEVFNIVQELNKYLKDRPRVRFSFGIQTFDDKILQSSGRQYTFLGIMEFLRGLQPLKKENNIFNFDFIAFGQFNQTRSGNKQLRDQSKLDFFYNFVHSGFADSFSLYTLELFQGSKRYQSSEISGNHPQSPNDNDIYEEFSILKEILLDAGYARYELSNFALPGKSSIHNMIYRDIGNYLGLGLASSSYLGKYHIQNPQKDILKELGICKSVNLGIPIGVRFTNTSNIKDYIAGQRIDLDKTLIMTDEDYLIEKFFLSLRTNKGIQNINEFKPVLVPDYETKIRNYQDQGFLNFDGKKISLTDSGMDVFNSIITELLAKI